MDANVLGVLFQLINIKTKGKLNGNQLVMSRPFLGKFILDK